MTACEEIKEFIRENLVAIGAPKPWGFEVTMVKALGELIDRVEDLEHRATAP